MTRLDNKEVILVACGGPSSSGKTTASKTLQNFLPDLTVIHLDDFYLHDTKIPIDDATGMQNWDCPEAIDFDRFIGYIRGIKHNNTSIPEINSKEPTEVNLKLSQKEIAHFQNKVNESQEIFQNKKIVLVDGFMLYHNPEIIELFDIKLFFHASYETLKERRESRSGYTTLDGFWVDPPHYFEKIVWPAYVRSHQYLFQDENVHLILKKDVRNKYNILDIDNEKEMSLFHLIEWSLTSIINGI